MESFYEGWVAQHEQLFGELAAAPRDRPDLALDLASRVLAHYHDYYNERSRLASADALAVLWPAWLSPFERTFLWISDWKPSLAFRLLRPAPLSPEQRRAVEELEADTVEEERSLAEEMTTLQEAMAGPEALGMLRAEAEVRAGAAEVVVRSVRVLVGSADALRARTIASLVEILSPVQMVEFLAAAMKLQLNRRRRGTATA